jgi:hypothetical protein
MCRTGAHAGVVRVSGASLAVFTTAEGLFVPEGVHRRYGRGTWRPTRSWG